MKFGLNLSNLWPVNAVLLSRPDSEHRGENGLNSARFKFGLFTQSLPRILVFQLKFCDYSTLYLRDRSSLLDKKESNQITFDGWEGFKLSFATYPAFPFP